MRTPPINNCSENLLHLVPSNSEDWTEAVD